MNTERPLEWSRKRKWPRASLKWPPLRAPPQRTGKQAARPARTRPTSAPILRAAGRAGGRGAGGRSCAARAQRKFAGSARSLCALFFCVRAGSAGQSRASLEPESVAGCGRGGHGFACAARPLGVCDEGEMEFGAT